MNQASLVGFLCILLSQMLTGTELAAAGSSNPAEHQPVVKDHLEPAVDNGNAASTLARRMAALEHSAAFQKAARDAWHTMQNGDAPFETGFAIDQDGRPGELQSSQLAPDGRTHLRIAFSSDSMGTFHVHNNLANPIPSPADIRIAKTTHKIVYVASRDGLYSIDPDGRVRHVFSNPTWFDQK